MSQIADKVIENLLQFQAPIDCPQLTGQEKASLFYFLTCAEMSLKRRNEMDLSQEESAIRNVVLKKVRIEECGEGYRSFKLQPRTVANNPLQIDSQVKESIHFNSLEEIIQSVELAYMIRIKQPTGGQNKDEIGMRDQSMILSLNELIQQRQIGVREVVQLCKQVLYGECVLKMKQRYGYLLNGMCKLMKQVVMIQHNQNEERDQESCEMVCDLVCSMPVYGEGVFEMLQELCKVYMGYFVQLKNVYGWVCKSGNDLELQQSCLRQLVRVSGGQVLEFLKSAEYQGLSMDQQGRWSILQEEALAKIEGLSSNNNNNNSLINNNNNNNNSLINNNNPNTESALIYIFYMGTKQIQIQKHAKILTGLIVGCGGGYSNLESDIASKLMKIKRAMDNELRENKTNMKIVMKTLSKSIVNWRGVGLRIMGAFVDFSLSGGLSVDELEQLNGMWGGYLEQWINNEQEQQEQQQQLVNRIMEVSLGVGNVRMSVMLLDGMSLECVSKLLSVNGRVLYQGKTLQQLLVAESKREISGYLLLRLNRENIVLLKENRNELLQVFLDLLSQDVEHMKRVLDDLLRETKPSGLIMVLILKCVNTNTNVYLEDYVNKIIQKPQWWRENNAIKQGLIKYITEFSQDRLLVHDQLSKQHISEILKKK